jgi:uncharacterized protein involved in exopolysaccharide biosynthesis
MNNEINSKPETEEIEINLSDIVAFFRQHWKRAVLWGLIGSIVGGIYAFTAQEEFESKAQLLPELQSTSSIGKLGGLGALAGLAGLDLSQMGSTEAIRPDLYPNILQSLPFMLHLLQQPVYSSKLQKTLTVEGYFEERNSNWLSNLLDNDKKEVKPLLDPKGSSQAVEIPKKKENLVKDLSKRIVTSFDRKTGVITVNSKMPDPVVAAAVANLSLQYLKQYVTTYRTDKSRKQVTFLGGQVAEAKRRYQSAEANLAAYRDRNRFLVLNTAKIEEQRLQADFLLAQSVYNDLSKQHEQAKIRVEEETPVFKILEPARIPLKKSEPKRLTLIAIFALMGALGALAWVFAKQFWAKIS